MYNRIVSVIFFILLFISAIIYSQSPALLSPSNGSSNIPITNTFYWNEVAGASSYKLQISNSNGFWWNQFDITDITADHYQVTGMYMGYIYYWRVGAIVNGITQWSAPQSFTTGSPGGEGGNPGPALVSPSNGATNVTTTQSLVWNNISGATYTIQISSSPYFSLIQETDSNLGSNSYNPTSLAFGTTYYWRVNATVNGETTDWTVARSFTTSLTAQTLPNAPVLSSPNNGSSDAGTSPTLAWNSVTGVNSYNIQVSDDSQFSNLVVDQSNIIATSYQCSGLSQGTTYYWRISSTNSKGTGEWSTYWSFSTSSASGTAPNLLTPVNGATDVAVVNTFYWNKVDNVTYTFQIGTTSTFSVLIENQSSLTDTSFQTNSLTYETTYYWRVGANDGSSTTWSEIRSFSTPIEGGTGGNGGPVLITPANSGTSIPTNQTFVWEGVEGATYRIQIATSQYFGMNQVDEANLSVPAYAASGLYLSTGYYWRVNATVNGETTDWSEIRSFTTAATSPTAPVKPILASPANNSTDISTNPQLSWYESSGTEYYQLQVATDVAFANIVIDQNNINNTSFSLSGLTEGTSYYWRVKAFTSSSNSDWSDIWVFKTTSENVELPLLSVSSPSDGIFTNQSKLTIVGSVEDVTNIVKINEISINVNSDGSFNESINLAEGLNNIVVKAFNSNNDSVIVSREITLDTIKPDLVVNEPSDSIVTNQNQILFSGSITDSNEVIFKINNIEVTLSNEGTFSSNQNLVEGTNQFILSAVDEAGNITDTTITVILDTSAPVITITNPSDSILIGSLNTIISGNVTDLFLEFLIINNDTINVGANGEFNHNISLSEGKNIITLEAFDLAGNYTTEQLTIFADITHPILTSISLADTAYTNQLEYSITGTVIDSSLFYVIINSDTVDVESNGSFTFNLDVEEGDNSVTLTLIDELNNSITSSKMIIRDTQLPEIAIESPVDSLITNHSSILVYGNINESNLDSLKVNGESVLVTSSGSFVKEIFLLEGINNIYVSVSDFAGNVFNDTLLVTLDTVLPTLTSLSISDNQITNNDTLLVTGIAGGGDIARVVLNGDTLAVNEAGEFSSEVILNEGGNSLPIIIEDFAGNRDSSNYNIILDSIEPGISYLINGIVVEADSAIVNIEVNVIDSTNTLVTANGLEPNTAATNSFTFLLTNKEENFEVTINATDEAGNISQIVDTIFVDLTTPVVSDYAIEILEVLEDSAFVGVSFKCTDSTDIIVKVNDNEVQSDIPNSYWTVLTVKSEFTEIILNITDEAGNTLNRIDTLFVDFTAPELVITSPSDGIVTTEHSILISGNVVDSSDVELKINNNIVTITPDNTFSSLVYLQSGLNTIILVATDKFNHTTSDTLQITSISIPLPPDPIIIAPLLDSTAFTPFEEATRFLYTGSNPIIYDVDTSKLVNYRLSVISGKVLDINGDPISGVNVQIHNTNDYGYTLSRTDGKFDLVANGGGIETINYSKEGYFSVQRKLDLPWREFSIIDDVVLTKMDTVVTNISFSEDLEVAKSSIVIDSDGTRSAVLMFEKGTTATMVLPDGSEKILPSISVRATEYTVGENGVKAMPAELPATSAYTYCVELSVDEAIDSSALSVQFDKPVSLYVDNFLGFPSGEKVPVGYYDRANSIWRPQKDGIIIDILGESDGYAQIDYNNNGFEDSYDSLFYNFGIDSTELNQLALNYEIGSSLWRVELEHFSPCDLNWMQMVEIAPGNKPILAENQADDNKQKSDNEKVECYSILNSLRQTVTEKIDISGVPFSLYYNSKRSSGYLVDRTLEIPIKNTYTPSSLNSINLNIEIDGSTYNYFLPADAPETFNFTWDGLDLYNRKVFGRTTAEIEIKYNYRTRYVSANASRRRNSFMSWPGMYAILTNARRESPTVTKSYSSSIGNNNISYGIANWTPSIVHRYSSNNRTIYFGNGTQGTTEEYGAIYNHIAGSKIPGYSGDGGPALDAQFESTYLGDIGPDGSLYVADFYSNVVRKIDPDGIITTIAGTGGYGFSGDGGLAVNAELAWPMDVAVDKNGNIFIADADNYRIRKIDKNGIISTIAGNGTDGVSPNGIPASQAAFSYWFNITCDDNGNIFVVDHDYSFIYEIDNTGTLYRVAGTGQPGYNGNRILAINAQISTMGDLVFDKSGNLLYADTHNNIVRKIRPDGIVETIVGTALDEGNSGDGDNATYAKLNMPFGIAVNSQNELFITDYASSNIRKINTNGKISTYAGKGAGAGGIIIATSVLPSSTLSESLTESVSASSKRIKIRKPKTKNAAYAISSNVTELMPNSSDKYDGFSAKRIALGQIQGIVAGKNSEYYYSVETEIKRVGPVFSNFSTTEYQIPSKDASEIYIFDKTGKHLKTINALTGAAIFKFTYEENGLLSEIIDSDSLITTIERDSYHNPTALVSPFGVKTNIGVNGKGYISYITNPNSDTTHYTYSNNGLLTHVIDPNKNLTEYKYDNIGFLTSEIDKAGNEVKLTRNTFENGFDVEITTPEGNSKVHSYENLSTGDIRLVTTNNDGTYSTTELITDGSVNNFSSDGTSSTIFYKPDPRFGMAAPLVDSSIVNTPSNLEILSQQGRTITQFTGDRITGLRDTLKINDKVYLSEFDGIYNEIISTTPEGRMSFTQIDSIGRAVLTGLPWIEPINYEYDENGFLKSVSQAGKSSFFDYDTLGRLASFTDPMNRTEKYEYDAVGRILKQTLSNGKEISYTYDANGNLTSITPPGRPAHIFNHTPLDYTSDYTPPTTPDSAGGTGYVYNKDRQLTHIIRPDSQIVEFVYDSTNCGCSGAGKPGEIHFDRGTILMSYNETSGNLETITTPEANTLTYTYDGSLPTSVNWNGTVNGTVGVTYNNDFNVITQSINDTNTISYDYDNDGLLVSAGAVDYSYDAQNGLLLSSSLGDYSSNYAYDNTGNVDTFTTKYNSDDLFKTVYEKDSLGRITKLTETVLSETNVFEYNYNTIGYLTEVVKNDTLISQYTYDDNGNRLSHATLTDTTYATYDDQDRMLSYGNTNFVYNKNGELLAKVAGIACPDAVCGDTTFYNYDNFGNLILVELPRHGEQANGTLIEHIIDGRDRRIGKKVNGVYVKRWLYQDQLNPVAEIDSAGNIIARYVYGNKINVPEYIIKGDTTYKIISDHLGSVRLVVNTLTNEIVQKIDYTAFGEIRSVLNISEFIDFGLAGGLYEPLTGLTRFGARDYDAELGRWTCKDPIGFNSHTTNLYSYCSNDPNNLVDINGKDAIYIIYQGYPIETGPFGLKLPLGHAAVIAVNPSTGYTRYYEYGRYNDDFGQVKRRRISNVDICDEGEISQESLEKLYEEISKKYGKGYPVNAIYFKDADYQKVVDYAEAVKNNPNRDEYSIPDNTCFVFAAKAIDAGR